MNDIGAKADGPASDGNILTNTFEEGADGVVKPLSEFTRADLQAMEERCKREVEAARARKAAFEFRATELKLAESAKKALEGINYRPPTDADVARFLGARPRKKA